ncbi:MAG: HAD family phosphatase [Proteobacteria bacterium]|nr:HAD family phosphatase [Pseudomonadota bacterium]
MSKKSGIEGVLFDIGGVLLDFDHMLSCRRIAALAELDYLDYKEVYKRLFASGLETEFDLGLPTELFYSRALEALGSSPEAISYEVFIEIWGAIFTERPEMKEIVAELRGNTRRLILSNTNAIHYSYIEEHFSWFKEFEASFLSFKLGIRKPDPAIFEAVIESTGLTPRSILYIDDIESHVMAAKEAGIEAVLFTTTDALRAVLKEAGLLKP